MKQIIQSKKVITMVVVSLLATVSIYSAAPIVAGPWLVGEGSAVGWAYRIISGAGTMITYGQLYREIFKPDSTDSKLRARPNLISYERMRNSSIYEGVAYGESVETANFSVRDRANYGVTYIDWIFIEWDEEEGEHKVNPDLKGRAYMPEYWDKSRFEWVTGLVGAAQKKTFFWPLEDEWEQGGYWFTYGESTKFEYPDVDIESDVWNPEWFGVALDGELVNQAKALGMGYTAKVHFKLQKLEWITDQYGSRWASGDMLTQKPVEIWFPGYEDKTVPKKLCPSHHRIAWERVNGGMDIVWNRNVTYSTALIQVQEVDRFGNRFGDIEEKGGQIQQNLNYVPYATELSND
jgi:hypothetical protein